MYYVIMDLEWNNIFLKRLRGHLNEIIEVGAVMLDENMEQCGEFSCLIRSQTGRKLSNRVVELTHLSDDELAHDGISFGKAMDRFSKWLGDRETTFMTWGGCDIQTLVENFSFFLKQNTIPFVTRYVDLQSYFQSIVAHDTTNQVGLAAAAQKLGLEPTLYNSHRALDDSLLAADCLKLAFDASRLDKFTEECNESFYKRIRLKAVPITDLNDPKIDPALLRCRCDFCGKDMEVCRDWELVGHAFKAVYVCHDCNLFKRCTARFTEYTGGMDVRLTYRMAYEMTEGSRDETGEG